MTLKGSYRDAGNGVKESLSSGKLLKILSFTWKFLWRSLNQISLRGAEDYMASNLKQLWYPVWWCTLWTVGYRNRKITTKHSFPSLTLGLKVWGGTCSLGKPNLSAHCKGQGWMHCNCFSLTLHVGMEGAQVFSTWIHHGSKPGHCIWTKLKSWMVSYCTTQSCLQVTGSHWLVHFCLIFQSAVGLLPVELTL